LELFVDLQWEEGGSSGLVIIIKALNRTTSLLSAYLINLLLESLDPDSQLLQLPVPLQLHDIVRLRIVFEVPALLGYGNRCYEVLLDLVAGVVEATLLG
jgi:hypothetical protein